MTYGMGSFDPAALVSAIREGMSSVNGSGDIDLPGRHDAGRGNRERAAEEQSAERRTIGRRQRNGFYTVSEF